MLYGSGAELIDMGNLQRGNQCKIHIVVASHRLYWIPKDSVYMPVQGGSAIYPVIGFQRDDAGSNISSRNDSFSELTVLYWAWKNLQADYLGLVHYRRYFTREETWQIQKRKKKILTGAEWSVLFQKYPVIVGNKRRYYIETNESHYCHAHHPEALDITRDILKEYFPDYSASFEKVMKRTWAHMFNMFAMRRELFDSYCQWLFAVLFELEKRLDISQYDVYERRVFGFIGELLLDVWLEQNHILYHEQNISFLEKQNWIKKGSAFLKRKFLSRYH